MKKLFLFIALFLAVGATSYGQSTTAQQKARQQTVQQSKAELNARATKAARKEAKRLKKEGWVVTPGALPLEKQLDRSYLMQYELDNDGLPKYLLGEGMSIGENYDAARAQAAELARINLAAGLQSEIETNVQTLVLNQQLSAEQAASVTRTVQSARSKISQSIGRTLTVVETYRTLQNRNREVLIRVSYSYALARAAAAEALRSDLEALKLPAGCTPAAIVGAISTSTTDR